MDSSGEQLKQLSRVLAPYHLIQPVLDLMWTVWEKERESWKWQGTWAWKVGMESGQGKRARKVSMESGQGKWAWKVGKESGQGKWAWKVGMKSGQGKWAWERSISDCGSGTDLQAREGKRTLDLSKDRMSYLLIAKQGNVKRKGEREREHGLQTRGARNWWVHILAR